MGWEQDGDYNGIKTLPFEHGGTLLATKGAVYGEKSPLDPASVWTIAIEPGATTDRLTGTCFERFTIRNTGANTLRYALTQIDAQLGSPQSHEVLAAGEVTREMSEFAMVAIYSTLGTDFEISGILNRRPNYQDALCPSGHPGHTGELTSDLTSDIDWFTVDTTYITADATEY